MISTHGLAARVPGRDGPRWLWRDLELNMAVGTVSVVVGPNGSGKTTLLRCLAGLRAPDAGEVLLNGMTLSKVHRRERARRVTYLPQTTPLYHDLRVGDLVMLGRAPHLGRLRPPSDEDHARVAAALERVDLSGLEDRGVDTLSGGERQRVMLARMLATEASMLLLDEPTTSLDIGHGLRLLELCRELARTGHGVVMALHDLDLARRYGDEAICLTGSTGHHVGGARSVLRPDVLGELFGVEVELAGDGLRFSSR